MPSSDKNLYVGSSFHPRHDDDSRIGSQIFLSISNLLIGGLPGQTLILEGTFKVPFCSVAWQLLLNWEQQELFF